ncbi:hypothetical protein DXV75_11820 [Alteromonas aestuariivivens]|uniref:Curli production assembly/transport component CsgG n=1 Tax=Alteromonas aestuariivivens TaxID=1938339 RepID=A0A3D8M555_9ALTE|nr:hypothetical protein [Alteromonas aestuariivivens]RDV24761.1 hypothetical protein DXV75_11820 [Alteromonas aestuariivivens]
MNLRLLNTTLAVTLSTVLVACMSTSTKVENVGEILSNPDFEVEMAKAEIMPAASEMSGKRTKVVVLPVRVSDASEYEIGAKREITAMLENGLLGAGADIVDRSLTGKLAEEIIAYEATGQFSDAGLDVADIVILPSISNVQVDSDYSPPSTYTDDGKTKTIPARCRFEGKVSGNIRVYSLPELKLVEGVPLNGSTSDYEETRRSNCPISQSQASMLAAKATKDGVSDMLHKVKKHLSQTGYVREYRNRGDDHLVFISMGSAQGLKPGQKIQFAHKFRFHDEYTNTTTITLAPYDFSGIVSDYIQAGSAWVIVEPEALNQLKQGDIAKTHFEANSSITLTDTIEDSANLIMGLLSDN